MDFHGSRIVLPQQRAFADLDEVREYVVRVCAAQGIRAPKVRHRRGAARAHYEQPGVIALPEGEDWAMREAVVLHELAHHVCGTMDHGPAFTASMLGLVEHELGAEAALVLSTAYLANQVGIDAGT